MIDPRAIGPSAYVEVVDDSGARLAFVRTTSGSLAADVVTRAVEEWVSKVYHEHLPTARPINLTVSVQS